MLLLATFPNAALKVVPVSSSVMISGFVDQADHIARIVRIAEEFYPKVINNMSVGGVQQVLLHVKIMEVSRTKLRQFGCDFTKVTGSNVLTTAPVGLLANTIDTAPAESGKPWAPVVANGGGGSFSFGVVDGTSAFFGVLDALRQDNLAKILAEPTLTTVSGRPASFHAGGSFYIVPQGLAASQPIQVFYGTHLDFVPIVLGNARIHLDVRPSVSQIDPSLTVEGYPGLLERWAETGAELQAGQTLAIAGLVQSRVEAQNGGLPWISELPYLGAAFRSVNERINEVELLMLVTPELVDAMDASEVPPCGPGTMTTSPSDWELFMKGHLEVPKCCPTGAFNGACPSNGSEYDQAPPDGMILGPGETVPTPQPDPAMGRYGRPVRGGAAMVADRSSGSGSYSRQSSSKASPPNAGAAAHSHNGPPGLIGPVGYDVVE